MDGVRLLGPSGTEVARAAVVEIDLRLSDLSEGRLALTRTSVQQPVVSLHQTSEGAFELLEAVTPIDSTDTRENDVLPRVDVDSIQVAEGSLVGVPAAFTIERIGVDGRATLVDGRLSVGLRSVRGVIQRNGNEVARIASMSGALELLEPGRQSTVTARVVSAESRVDFDGTMRWGERTVDGYRGTARFDLRPEIASRLGLQDVADSILGAVVGELLVEGGLEAASLNAELETAGGPLSVDGTLLLPELRGRVHLSTLGVRLGDVVNVAGLGSAAGRLDVEVFEKSDDGSRRATVGLREGRYDEYAFPPVSAALTIAPDVITLTDLAIPAWTDGGGWLRAHGVFAPSGPVQFAVDARFPQLARDPTVRRLAPNVRAGVELDVEASVDTESPSSINASGTVRAERALLPGGVSIDRLRLAGSAHGRLPNPEVSLELAVRGLDATGVRVGRAALSIDGGPRDYRLAGQAQVASKAGRTTETFKTRLRFATTYEAAVERVTVNGSMNAEGVFEAPVSVRVDRLVVDPSRAIEVGTIDLRAGQSRIEAAGIYRFDGVSDIRASLTEVDAEGWGPLVGASNQVGGIFSGTVALRGTPTAPDVQGEVSAREGWVGDLLFDRAHATGRLTKPGRNAAFHASADLTGGGRLRASAEGDLARRRDVAEALMDARWQGALEVRDFALASLQAALPEDAPHLEGTLDVTADYQGTLDHPQSEVDVRGRHLGADEWILPDVDSRVVVRDDALSMTVGLTVEDATLASAEATTRIRLRDLLSGLPVREWFQDPWSFDATLTEQRLDQLPGPAHVPVPLLVSATIHAGGGGGTPTLARVEAEGELVRGETRLAACDWEHPIHFTSQATLARGRTTVALSATTDDRVVLNGTATMATPVDRWLEDRPPTQLPEVAAAVAIENLPTHSLPVVCEEHGRIDGDIVLTGLFGARPSLGAEMVVSELSLGDERGRAEIHVEVEAADGETSAIASLRHDDRPAMAAELRSPTTWNQTQRVPVFDLEQTEGTAEFENARVGPLLGFVPGLTGGRGRISGRVRAWGHQHRHRPDFDMEGQLSFENVGFAVESPVFRVDDLEGSLELRRNFVRFSEIRFRDRGGEASIDGEVTLDEELTPETIAVDLAADDFPVRVDGVVLATIAGRTRVEGSLAPNDRRLEVTLRDLAIKVPRDIGRTLQPLEDHAGVYYETHPHYLAAHLPHESVSEAPDAPTFSLYPLRVAVDATEAFWVRRDDFAFHVSSELTVRLTERGPRIRGPVTIRRGFMVVPVVPTVSKRFELLPSQLRFDGSAVIDPILEVTAVHHLGNGETITMYVTGRLSQPMIRFESSEGDLTTAEIVESVFGGSATGTSETQADQVLSALAGMASGLLGDLARQEYGDLIPVLRLEAGRNSGAVRAGIRAGELIPAFLENVITGAYLEGFVSATAAEDGGAEATSSSGGFLLELYFPNRLSATGTFQEPTNWSLDFTWEP